MTIKNGNRLWALYLRLTYGVYDRLQPFLLVFVDVSYNKNNSGQSYSNLSTNNEIARR